MWRNSGGQKICPTVLSNSDDAWTNQETASHEFRGDTRLSAKAGPVLKTVASGLHTEVVSGRGACRGFVDAIQVSF